MGEWPPTEPPPAVDNPPGRPLVEVLDLSQAPEPVLTPGTSERPHRRAHSDPRAPGPIVGDTPPLPEAEQHRILRLAWAYLEGEEASGRLELQTDDSDAWGMQRDGVLAVVEGALAPYRAALLECWHEWAYPSLVKGGSLWAWGLPALERIEDVLCTCGSTDTHPAGCALGPRPG